MNWDWDKLQSQKKKRDPVRPPDLNDFGDMGKKLKGLGNFRLPGGGKLLFLLLLLLWLGSGYYSVQPDEIGVVRRFGAFERLSEPGPHLHLPYPVESVDMPKVTQVRRTEVGFRSLARGGQVVPGQFRDVPDESLMLTGDENIVDVQFIVQYQIKDPKAFLFNIAEQEESVKNVAEAAMREVIGNNKIDSALTQGKLEIQNQTQQLMQDVLDRYQAGVRVAAVQLQDVHPPQEVVDAFKDVASAREDKSRIINEAEAYQNDILPKARGQAAVVVNQAEADQQSRVLAARGGAQEFSEVLQAYRKAKDVTRQRMYLQTLERILSNPDVEVTLLPSGSSQEVLPFLRLDGSTRNSAPMAKGN